MKKTVNKSSKRKLPSWLLILWGGFNAGAIMGIIDSLMVIFFGLATFDRMGQIMGFIFWDALGLAIIGSLIAAAVFLIWPRFVKTSPRILSVANLFILVTIALGFSFSNVVWSFKTLHGQPPENAPHVVLVTLDTLRTDATGSGGNPLVRTPVLDRLARLGRQFCNAVCPVPMTTPSHASMLTGTIPAVHGARENRYRLGPENNTVTEILRDNGYRTAAFISCFPLDRRFGLNQGFMLYEDRFGVPGDLRQASWYKLWKNWREKGRMERNCRYTNSLVLPWVRKYTGDETPVFLWVHYFDPHSPYAPPEHEKKYYLNTIQSRFSEWPDNYAMENAEKSLAFSDIPVEPGRPEEMYYGEVSEMDRALGELFHQMAVSGVMNNSLILTLADHGESFGEHGFFYTHGEDIFEPALSIPLIAYSGNNRVSTGLDSRLACASDVATTILPYTGLSIPAEMEGFNLLAPEGKRRNALIENYGIIMNDKAMKQRGLRTSDKKFIHYLDTEYRALYDLNNDPGETHNIQAADMEYTDQFESQTISGFTATADRRKISEEDLSPETLEKLKSLGYMVP